MVLCSSLSVGSLNNIYANTVCGAELSLYVGDKLLVSSDYSEVLGDAIGTYVTMVSNLVKAIVFSHWYSLLWY